MVAALQDLRGDVHRFKGKPNQRPCVWGNVGYKSFGRWVSAGPNGIEADLTPSKPLHSRTKPLRAYLYLG